MKKLKYRKNEISYVKKIKKFAGIKIFQKIMCLKNAHTLINMVIVVNARTKIMNGMFVVN